MSPALGAEVHGVDLSSITDALVASIHEAFLRYGVLVFRKQSLDSQAFLSFARCLGDPIEYPFVKGLEAFPEIIEVKKTSSRAREFWRHLAFRHHLPATTS